MDLSRYADLFLSESREHVALMNASLLELERGTTDAGVVDGLFRSIHTIKGMSATMGYAGITELSHTLESVLDGIRGGRVRVSAEVVQALFQGADAIEGALDGAVAGRADGADLAAATERLRSLSTTTEAPTLAPSAAPAAQAVRDEPSRSGVGAERRHARIEVSRLDSLMNGIGELATIRGRLSHLAAAAHQTVFADEVAHLSKIVTELHDDILASRMVPASDILEGFPRFVRDTAQALHKDVEFVTTGTEIELDRAVLDGVREPIMHLLRNALDHGIEAPAERLAAGKPGRARLEVAVVRDRDAVVMRVRDDGRGVDRERVVRRGRELGLVDPAVTDVSDDALFRLISRPGFSTAVEVTALSGRGVGVDAVLARVRTLGGSVELRTAQGKGTTVSLRLPLSIAIVRALLVRAGTETYAIPLTHVRETLALEEAMCRSVHGRDSVVVRDAPLILRRLRDLVRLPRHDAAERDLVVLRIAEQHVALAVDDLVGQEDIVVKQFDSVRDAPPLFSGATLLADGAPALIFDVGSLV